MAINLSSLRRGPVDQVPLRMILAGSPGVGKTTFGCSAPNPVVIQTEDGLEPLIQAGVVPDTVARFPFAQGFGDVLDSLEALWTEAHDFQTLVLDSLDWLEPMVWRATCEAASGGKKIESIEDFGYGKGYIEADKQWAIFRDGLNALRRDRSMNVILIAHTEVKRFEAPDEQPYDRYQIKLHKRASALMEEWADVVGIAKPKNLVTTRTEGAGKTEKKVHKAVATQDRVLFLADKPSAVAKNRYNLPSEIPFSWASFSQALYGK